MSEKEPPKAPVAPEGRFQTEVDSYFKRAPPLTAEQQKKLAEAAKQKQLVEQGDGEGSGEGVDMD